MSVTQVGIQIMEKLFVLKQKYTVDNFRDFSST